MIVGLRSLPALLNSPDTVAVMDDGRIVHSGRMDALAEERDLEQKLLGLSLDTHQ